jgi:ABC-2 type transport system permease protein
MLYSVALRTLKDQRKALLAWAISFAALVAMYVAVYPSVKGNSSFAKLIDQMPKTYRALFTTGGGADFTTPAGYLNTELLTFMGPLLLLVYAIGAGAFALAGEEERGTIDLLLATPISRAKVALGKFSSLVLGTAVLAAVLWAALAAEGAAAGMELPLGNTAAALLQLALLGVEFGTLALFVGALSGNLTLSRAVPALVAVVAYLINGLGPMVGWLNPLRPASPFFQYIGNDPLRNGLSLRGLVVSTLTIAILVVASLYIYRRRDLVTR